MKIKIVKQNLPYISFYNFAQEYFVIKQRHSKLDDPPIHTIRIFYIDLKTQWRSFDLFKNVRGKL